MFTFEYVWTYNDFVDRALGPLNFGLASGVACPRLRPLTAGRALEGPEEIWEIMGRFQMYYILYIGIDVEGKV